MKKGHEGEGRWWRRFNKYSGTNCWSRNLIFMTGARSAGTKIWLGHKLRCSESSLYDSGSEYYARNMAWTKTVVPENMYLRLMHGELCSKYGLRINCGARKLASMTSAQTAMPRNLYLQLEHWGLRIVQKYLPHSFVIYKEILSCVTDDKISSWVTIL